MKCVHYHEKEQTSQWLLHNNLDSAQKGHINK
jgi:hypothetical protein